MNDRNRKTPTATPTPQATTAHNADYLKSIGRLAERARRDADECAQLTSLPIQHIHAAGIDVGDASHWVCVDQTPDGGDAVREFPAHTPGLRQLIAWLTLCGVTTVAPEASGVYGHVLFLTLLEAGFHVVTTAPTFTRQIKGRPKIDQRDCQWIQRLHKHGLLPSIFQPNEATQTLRDYVRQRANLVRLSGHHIQRMQKALELMNLKLTKVLGDVTGVTGLKILRALLAGERDPRVFDDGGRDQDAAVEIGEQQLGANLGTVEAEDAEVFGTDLLDAGMKQAARLGDGVVKAP